MKKKTATTAAAATIPRIAGRIGKAQKKRHTHRHNYKQNGENTKAKTPTNIIFIR